VQHLGIAAAVSHPVRGEFKIVGSPINMHETPKKIRRPTPDRGQHTDEILREILKYDPGRIAALRASGALGAVP